MNEKQVMAGEETKISYAQAKEELIKLLDNLKPDEMLVVEIRTNRGEADE